jgi:O-acetylhomoserine (thiol)-lyase
MDCSSKGEKLGFDTLKVRGGYDSAAHGYSAQVPIYQTAAFDLVSCDRAERIFAQEEKGFTYSRTANPTVAALEARIAALDGATGAVALATGMAAVTAALLTAVDSGGRVLTTVGLYGGSFELLARHLPRFGIGVDFAEDPTDPESFARAIRPETRAIYVESVSNPNAIVAELEGLAALAHANGIPLIVDNTIPTPALLRPFDFGADIIVYSATKALSGHGDALAGLVLERSGFDWGNGKFPSFSEPDHCLRDRSGEKRSYAEAFPAFPFTARIRIEHLGIFGAPLGPFDAYLVLLGIETLSERLAKQVANAQKLVHYLEGHDRVAWVHHPSAKLSPSATLAAKYLPKGSGGLFSFGLKGGEAEVRKLLDSVKVFSYQANVGDARSLIVNCPRVTHAELDEEELKLAGISPESIRVSVGLEDPEDLIADLDQAIATAFA